MNAAHKRELMARMAEKLEKVRAERAPRAVVLRGPRGSKDKLHLLDLPDEMFTRFMHGTLNEPPDSFLLAILRWSSRGWPGPSVRMTRSYNYNASYALGGRRTAGGRKTRIPRAA